MDVVLPTPFTPMTSTTLGLVDKSSAVSPTFSFSIKISRSACFTSSPRWMLFWYTTSRSFFTASCATVAPRSAIMRLSSSSS